MVTRYIGDTHLYYPESLLWRNMTLDEYANDLVTKWDCIVQNDDDLTYMVGDIGDYCIETVDVIKSLRGRKILVKGNHDVSWKESILRTMFEEVVEVKQLKNVWIQHIPITTDNYNCYVVHAHHHQYSDPSMRAALRAYLKDQMRYNCAADLNGNTPCTLTQLMINKENIREQFKEVV